MIADNGETKFNNVVQPAIADLIGKDCCRQRVGRMRSLSLGFGKKIPHGKARLVDDFYGEWEIGTYLAAWRVVHDGRILCGSQDIVDSVPELDERLSKIKFGRIKTISVFSKFDIRINFDGEKYLDFLGSGSDDDELFHIFCPESMHIEYSISGGWKIGKTTP